MKRFAIIGGSVVALAAALYMAAIIAANIGVDISFPH